MGVAVAESVAFGAFAGFWDKFGALIMAGCGGI